MTLLIIRYNLLYKTVFTLYNMKLNILKFVYNSLLTGMPLLTYNPFNKNTFHVPMTVRPFSTYINFRLSDSQVDFFNNYIQQYSNLSLIPVKILENSPEEFIISVNIYNCTSPVFLNDKKEITRCEINTYVQDNNHNGTIILDYLSNEISMDPVNIVKKKDNIFFNNNDIFNYINCHSLKEKISLSFYYTPYYCYKNFINDALIKYTDRIYYKNGLFDKVFFDSSLSYANVKSPYFHHNFSFIYQDINFTDIHSIFFFENYLQFIGGMWDNLFSKP